jgi:hypothetical protein
MKLAESSITQFQGNTESKLLAIYLLRTDKRAADEEFR